MAAAAGAGEATLSLPDGRTVKLNVLTDTEGNKFLDVTKLYGETGAFVTAGCQRGLSCSMWRGAEQKLSWPQGHAPSPPYTECGMLPKDNSLGAPHPLVRHECSE